MELFSIQLGLRKHFSLRNISISIIYILLLFAIMYIRYCAAVIYNKPYKKHFSQPEEIEF